MRPVRQRRPRRGADFVLPDVPMLDSPDWSDDDGSVRSSMVPHAQAQAHAAAMATAAQMMFAQNMAPPYANPHFSPAGMPRVSPPGQFPQPMINGMLVNTPGMARMSPGLEQRQHQQAMHPFVPGGNPARRERRGGGDRGPLSDQESNFRRRVEPRRGESAGNRGRQQRHSKDNESSPQRQPEEQSAADQEEAEDEEETVYIRERRSPTQVAIGSFANPTLASRTQFAVGSLFVPRNGDEGEYDEEEEYDDEDTSLTNSSAGKPFSDDDDDDVSGGSHSSDASEAREGSESARRSRRREESDSIVAPSYVNYATRLSRPRHSDDSAAMDLRRPSLFAMAASPNAGAAAAAGAARGREASAAASIFNGYLQAAHGVDESPINRLQADTSTIFVGATASQPQLQQQQERSVGPGGYTYDANPQGSSSGPDATRSETTVTTSGGPAPGLTHRHGTFLLSTEDANRSPAAAPHVSPVGLSANQSPQSGGAAASPLTQPLSLSPGRHAEANRSTMSLSAALVLGPAARSGLSPTRNMSQPSSETRAGRDHSESAARMPSVEFSVSRHDGRQGGSGEESEEERYEQLQRSRFFQSLNSRMTIRRAVEADGSRAGLQASTLAWHGLAPAENNNDDEVVMHGATPGSHGRGGAAASVSAPSSAGAVTDRLNFRSRIATRQQQQQQQTVQPLSRFPPVNAAAASPLSTSLGKPPPSNRTSPRQSPGSTALNQRRGLTSRFSAVDSMGFSLDANLLSNAAAATPGVPNGGAAAGGGGFGSAGAVRRTPSLSPTVSALLGGVESDEYGLLYWASSPDGARRTSAAAVDDVAAAKDGGSGAVPRRTSLTAAGGQTSGVMPISLQPSLRRPQSNTGHTSTVTVISPSAKSSSGSPYYSASSPQHERSSAPSVLMCDPHSPTYVPPSSSSAPVIHAQGTEHPRRRSAGGSEDVSWAPQDDVYYFQSGCYSPMSRGLPGSSQSLATQLRGPPSFYSYRNDDYFFPSSFRSATAPPPAVRAEQGLEERLELVPAAGNGGNSPGGVDRRLSNPPRGGAYLTTPFGHQKRLSGGDVYRGLKEKPKRVASAPPPTETVTMQSLAQLSREAAHRLEEYDFPCENDAVSNAGGYYGFDSDSEDDGFMPAAPTGAVTSVSQPPAAFPAEAGGAQEARGPAVGCSAQSTASPNALAARRSGDSVSFSVHPDSPGCVAQLRQRFSMESTEEYTFFRPGRRRSSTSVSPHDVKAHSRRADRGGGDEQSSRQPPRSRAPSGVSSRSHDTSASGGKGKRGMKQKGTPPLLAPQPYASLHATENGARVDRAASTTAASPKARRQSPSTRYNPRAASVTKN